MDLLILVGVISFFGLALISTVAHRNTPPAAKIILVRADQLAEPQGDRGSAGFGIFLLLAVVLGALFFL